MISFTNTFCLFLYGEIGKQRIHFKKQHIVESIIAALRWKKTVIRANKFGKWTEKQLCHPCGHILTRNSSIHGSPVWCPVHHNNIIFCTTCNSFLGSLCIKDSNHSTDINQNVICFRSKLWSVDANLVVAFSSGTLSNDCSISFGKVFPNWLQTV